MHANADLLSRLPLPMSPTNVPQPAETVLLMEKLQSSPVMAVHIRKWISRDTVLSHVRNFVLKGWRSTTEAALQPYQKRKDELSVHDGCLLWGCRVIVPPAGRQSVMDELHEGHPAGPFQDKLFLIVVDAHSK